MMSVLEYALDVNKSVDEILALCKKLNIEASNEDDELDEEDITELDNVIANEEIEEENINDEIEDELIEKEKNKIEDIVSGGKNKKNLSNKTNKTSNNSKKLIP